MGCRGSRRCGFVVEVARVATAARRPSPSILDRGQTWLSCPRLIPSCLLIRVANNWQPLSRSAVSRASCCTNNSTCCSSPDEASDQEIRRCIPFSCLTQADRCLRHMFVQGVRWTRRPGRHEAELQTIVRFLQLTERGASCSP